MFEACLTPWAVQIALIVVAVLGVVIGFNFRALHYEDRKDD